MPGAPQTLVRFVLYLGCAAAAAACAGGCTTAAVVSAGTMVGLAASAVSTGADVYQLGKLDAADKARFDEWIAAARAAADDLHLSIERESLDDRKAVWRCTLRDDRGTRIKMMVQRRTATLCRTRIDVGWFGSEPTARLILAELRRHKGPPPMNEPITPGGFTTNASNYTWRISCRFFSTSSSTFPSYCLVNS